MRRIISICCLLVIITLVIYWPAKNYDVVFYDDTFFTDNPGVQSGLSWHSFIWAMTAVIAANWHPVTSLSFVLTHQLFGTNSGAEHLVNVLFHAANAVLLFLVLKRMTGTVWHSALVAALFAWHPLRVESVAWVSERKDVLCGFFMLLALWMHGRFAQEKSKAKNQKPGGIFSTLNPRRWTLDYWLTLLFFALGLMSKAMVVTLPFLLLLLDLWPLKRIQNPKSKIGNLKPLLVEKIPFFVLSVLFCLVTFIVQHHANAMPSAEQMGLEIRCENAVVSYLRYLALTVWPANLAVYYPFPFNNDFYLALWPSWEIGAVVLLLVCVSILCLKQVAHRPYLAIGWFWYLGTMVPVIGLVQVGGQGMADRYTYIPLIGPVISLVWLISEAWREIFFQKVLLTTLATVVLTALAIQTRCQLQYWKNTISLFSHTIDVTGQNPRAEYILGLGLEHEGRISEAMFHYRIATMSQPTVNDAFIALGRLLGQQGKWEAAEKTYSTLLTREPHNFTANLYLASVLSHLGQKEEAFARLKTALQTCPNAPETMNDLAWTLATSETAQLRDGERAIELAERACELTHYQETVMIGTLAAAYAEAGRFDDAIATAQRACALATESDQADLLKINQQLLELYRQHQPYHESANPSLSN